MLHGRYREKPATNDQNAATNETLYCGSLILESKNLLKKPHPLKEKGLNQENQIHLNLKENKAVWIGYFLRDI